ncbi:autotransporter outer membrane beta-barrel domain-containing protein [Pasteurellaceae bacterium LIM206]|nr:autotransporter outer membrane beta-barrel domain-containing protein [Pasteurellaceae bacterium LIM206]
MHYLHQFHKTSIAMFISLLCSNTAFAIDGSSNLNSRWQSVNSKIENGSFNKKYYYLDSENKLITLTEQVITDNNINANIIGAISDNNIGDNKKLTGYDLTVQNINAADVLASPVLVFGAGSQTGTVEQNNVSLINITEGFDMDVRGGHSYSGVANNNSVTVFNSTLDHIYGGSSRIGSATNNKVNISQNSDIRIVHGGRAWFSNEQVSGNTINIIGSKAYWVYGGESQAGTISGNKVTISAAGISKSLSRGVYGGKSVNGKGNVLQNEVVISGSDIEDSYETDAGVYGGKADRGSADLNKVTITSDGNGKSSIATNVFGGASGSSVMGSADTHANQNEVTIIGSDALQVYGGSTSSGSANGNIVNVQTDGVNRANVRTVYGGKSGSGAANENKIRIVEANVTGNVYGGYIGYAYSSPSANNNQITLEDTDISGDVYAGYNEGYVGDTVNNVVNLYNNVSIGGDLAGGYGNSTDDYFSGNSLNVYAKTARVGNLANFEYINFFIPHDIADGNTILTLTGSADTDLSQTKVSAKIDNNATLYIGNRVVLLDNAQGSISAPLQLINANQGISNTYQLSLESDEHQIVATVKGKSYNPKQKNLIETGIGMLGMLQNGNALLSTQAKSAMLNASKGDELGTFVVASANNTKLKSGSHVKIKGVNLVTGLSKQVTDRLIAGAFFELGFGNYDSFNSFGGADVTGSGNSRYYGVGTTLSMDLSRHFYLDATARLGRIKADYNSSDFDGYVPDYNSLRTYYGVNLGVGKIVQISNSANIDIYGKAFYTRMNGDNVEILATQYRFEAIDSLITRVGAKFNHSLNQYVTWYLAGAFEREFDGKAKGKNITFKQDITAPTLRGNSGVGELGVVITPKANFNIGLNMQGLVGKRQGISGGLRLGYRF